MKDMKKHIQNLMFMYKQIFGISRLRVWLIILQCIIATLNMIVDTYFVKYIIDGLLANYHYTYYVAVIAVKLGLLLVMQCCDNVFYNYIFKKSDMKIQKELALRLFDNVKTIKLNKIEDATYYDKYQKAISEASDRSSALLSYFTYILSTLLNIIGLMAVIVALDPALIIISVIGMLVTVWANIANAKNVYNADMSFVSTNRKIDYIQRIFYLPQYAKDVRRTRVPELLEKKYDEAIQEKQLLVKKHWPKIITIAISGSWFYNVVNVGVSYFYLVIKAVQKIISIGDVTSLAYAVNQLSNSLLQISNIIPQGIQHSLYIQNYRDMLDEFDEEDKYQSQEKITIEDFEDIELSHVSFTYPAKKTMALDDINLSIKKGEHVAIVGENGSGKTTLAKVLSGLYEPTQGKILMGEIDYKNLSFDSLIDYIGVVDQDFQHYAFSITENISLQSDIQDVDSEKVKDVLEKVNMRECILNSKNGMDSIYSKEFDSEGVEFSGGQLQRLAIARVIYSDTMIWILDEPSSALDPISEQKIFDTIFENSKEKTLILISHKLSCVKDVDCILVMEEGKIIERGTHKELMKLDGKYAEMYKLQGKRYGI